jgi:hypothetical protein
MNGFDLDGETTYKTKIFGGCRERGGEKFEEGRNLFLEDLFIHNIRF